MQKILHVVGARPNYMKIAPVMAEMGRHPGLFTQVLVHTGQHYDDNMSKIFFEDLSMAAPDELLHVGSGTHAEQTARTMLAFEPVVLKHRPDWVMVVGDVNSTLACALVCVKLGVPVAHIEAGLRSRDWTMPEEINRVLTDQVASLLFTPSRDADDNLLREGITPSKIHFVGNVMIDTLARMLPHVEPRSILQNMRLKPKEYIVVTLHRPANVDDSDTLRGIVNALCHIGQRVPIIFSVHPRTRRHIEQLCLPSLDSCIRLLEPLGYIDFIALIRLATAVVTDSGGVQEETTYLGIPCFTIRQNTERPVTIEVGTNQLVAPEPDALIHALEGAMDGNVKVGHIPERWDGLAARRIVDIMRSLNRHATL